MKYKYLTRFNLNTLNNDTLFPKVLLTQLLRLKYNTMKFSWKNYLRNINSGLLCFCAYLLCSHAVHTRFRAILGLLLHLGENYVYYNNEPDSWRFSQIIIKNFICRPIKLIISQHICICFGKGKRS